MRSVIHPPPRIHDVSPQQQPDKLASSAVEYLLPELWLNEIIKKWLIDMGFHLRTLVALRRTCRWLYSMLSACPIPGPGDYDKFVDRYDVECRCLIKAGAYAPLGWRIRFGGVNGIPTASFVVKHEVIAAQSLRDTKGRAVFDALDRVSKVYIGKEVIWYAMYCDEYQLIMDHASRIETGNLVDLLGHALALRALGCFEALTRKGFHGGIHATCAEYFVEKLTHPDMHPGFALAYDRNIRRRYLDYYGLGDDQYGPRLAEHIRKLDDDASWKRT